MRILLGIALALCTLGANASAQQAEDSFETVEARVQSSTQTLCQDGTNNCAVLQVEALNGTIQGQSFTVEVDTADERIPHDGYTVGDALVVQTAIVGGERTAFVSDTVRRPALGVLFAVFVGMTIFLGGIRALRPFFAMMASLVVLGGGMIPLFLHGTNPLLISIAGSLIIMAITFIVGHGASAKVYAAFIGTGISLCATALLSIVFSASTKLTGTAEEEMLFLLSEYPNLDTRGLLLAGIVIGCLGVLDDITISQSSAVFELRRANPTLGKRELYTRALRIGSDHIAAAINTLVLAYAGASLPLLLLLFGIQGGESVWTFLNREIMAEEIVRTLVGSMGLLLAVPITTWIASVYAEKAPIQSDSRHSHFHIH